jgi:BTB/POZ domain-containing protein KCTD9
MSHLPTADPPINLIVGECSFTTTRRTLTHQSPYFTRLFATIWHKKPADDPHFVDADPALFEHILRYLRRSVLPIFHSRADGHNEALYAALLHEARHFEIARLARWLETRSYVLAVREDHSVHVVSGADVPGTYENVKVASDEELVYRPAWVREESYECPRRIPEHLEDETKCGKKCKEVQDSTGEGTVCYNSMNLVIVRKRLMVDAAVCRDWK